MVCEVRKGLLHLGGHSHSQVMSTRSCIVKLRLSGDLQSGQKRAAIMGTMGEMPRLTRNPAKDGGGGN